MECMMSPRWISLTHILYKVARKSPPNLKKTNAKPVKVGDKCGQSAKSVAKCTI